MEMRIKRTGTSHFTGKPRKRAAVIAMTAAAVAAAVVLGGPAGASPLAARAAAVSGTEHFQIMSTSTTSLNAGVIVYGAFTASGVDHESSSTANTATDRFTFAGGSFKVTHTGKGGTQTFNSKTCLFVLSQPGIYTLSGGTGTYKGISGHGTFKLSVIGLGPKLKNGKCNPSETAIAIAQQTVIDASGSVKIP